MGISWEVRTLLFFGTLLGASLGYPCSNLGTAGGWWHPLPWDLGGSSVFGLPPEPVSSKLKITRDGSTRTPCPSSSTGTRLPLLKEVCVTTDPRRRQHLEKSSACYLRGQAEPLPLQSSVIQMSYGYHHWKALWERQTSGRKSQRPSRLRTLADITS